MDFGASKIYMGVSLNGGTPISHPKMIIFSRKTNGCWMLLGITILGNPFIFSTSKHFFVSAKTPACSPQPSGAHPAVQHR